MEFHDCKTKNSQSAIRESVGLEGNRLQIRLAGAYFAAFLSNRMTIALQNRQTG
jgi:hypothetical protein